MPPHNLEAERAVLGAMLLDPAARWQVSTTLQASDFYAERHQVIYRALLNAPEPIDLATLAAYLRDRGELEAAGGLAYLALVERSVPTTANVEAYAWLVRRAALLRRLQDAGRRIVDLAADADDPEEAVAQAADMLLALAAEETAAQEVATAAEWLADLQERARRGEQERLLTGYPMLDNLCVLRPGQVTVLAGGTSSGKTAMALAIAANVAQQGRPVVYWSGEMERAELYERLTAALAGLNLQALQTGALRPQEWDAAWEAARRIDSWPLVLDDQPRTIREIEARCRALAAAGRPPALVVVDYLGLVSDLNDPASLDAERRDLRVGWALWRCRQMARALQAHVLVLHQFNRDPARRKTMRPQLTDLRDSSQVEQHSHRVWLLYQPAYDDGITDQAYRERCKGLLEVIVAKQRQGPRGSVWLRYEGATQRISHLPCEQWPEGGDRL